MSKAFFHRKILFHYFSLSLYINIYFYYSKVVLKKELVEVEGANGKSYKFSVQRFGSNWCVQCDVDNYLAYPPKIGALHRYGFPSCTHYSNREYLSSFSLQLQRLNKSHKLRITVLNLIFR